MFIIMKKHIIFFLLLAIAFTAMAAPAATPKTPATKGRCRRSTSPMFHIPSQKSAPTKHRLFPRSDTLLCGMKIRSATANKCEGNPEYIPDSSGRLGWVQWNTMQACKEKTQCDHLVELQMITTALENAGFCKAWTRIEALWDPLGTKVQSTMKGYFDATVRKEANNKEGLFNVEESFNREKGQFFSNVINNRVHRSSPNLKGYFTDEYKKKAADIALKIDNAATGLLTTLTNMAMPAGYDEEKSTKEENDYVRALGKAKALFESKSNPVVEMWRKVQRSI